MVGRGVDGDPRRRAAAPRRSRLRDISHLYLSKSSRPPGEAAPLPRRVLRLGFVGDGLRLAKVDVCSNMAVQLARLGRRTLVVDMDPLLPNAGFHLGLEPAAYMAHLREPPQPRIERGLLGLRLLEGVANSNGCSWPEELEREVQRSDCVLVTLPGLEREAGQLLARLEVLLEHLRPQPAAQPRPGPQPTTPGRAAAQERALQPAAPPLDALVFVLAAAGMRLPEFGHVGGALAQQSPVPEGTPAAPRTAAAAPPAGLLDGMAARLAHGRLHLVVWGDGEPQLAVRPWARIRPDATGNRYPLSSLDPEAPGARLYEGLVQSLLASYGSRGGADVRFSAAV